MYKKLKIILFKNENAQFIVEVLSFSAIQRYELHHA